MSTCACFFFYFFITVCWLSPDHCFWVDFQRMVYALLDVLGVLAKEVPVF